MLKQNHQHSCTALHNRVLLINPSAHMLAVCTCNHHQHHPAGVLHQQQPSPSCCCCYCCCCDNATASRSAVQVSCPVSTPVPLSRLSSLSRRLRFSAFISPSVSLARLSIARSRSRSPSISPAAYAHTHMAPSYAATPTSHCQATQSDKHCSAHHGVVECCAWSGSATRLTCLPPVLARLQRSNALFVRSQPAVHIKSCLSYPGVTGPSTLGPKSNKCWRIANASVRHACMFA